MRPVVSSIMVAVVVVVVFDVLHLHQVWHVFGLVLLLLLREKGRLWLLGFCSPQAESPKQHRRSRGAGSLLLSRRTEEATAITAIGQQAKEETTPPIVLSGGGGLFQQQEVLRSRSKASHFLVSKGLRRQELPRALTPSTRKKRMEPLRALWLEQRRR
jgi:hypothetical protein